MIDAELVKLLHGPYETPPCASSGRGSAAARRATGGDEKGKSLTSLS
jgi:hypothetical protein